MRRIFRIPALWATPLLCLLATLAVNAAPARAEKIYFPGKSFGEEGTGPGRLKEPIGIAVNDATSLEPGAGDVYVADKGNKRVDRFSTEGVYLGEFDGSGTYEVEGKEIRHGKAAPSGAFAAPEEIAVDSCTILNERCSTAEDPSVGDVYVADTTQNAIDKFSSTGEYEGQLTEIETCIGQGGTECGVRPLASLRGIAVDEKGDLWIYQASPHGRETVTELTSEGHLVQSALTNGFTQESYGIAVTSPQDYYLVEGLDRSITRVFPAGNVFGNVGSGVTALALVPFRAPELAGDLLADTASGVSVYEPLTEPRQPPVKGFPGQDVPPGFPGFAESFGIAVNAQATVFATEKAASTTDRVQTFAYVSAPTVSTKPASEVSETALTLNATVDPEGEEIKQCFFEYGTKAGGYEHTVPCAQSPASLTGSEPKPVSTTVEGLSPASVRSFRVVAENSIGVSRSGAGFTVARPQASQLAPAGVGSSSGKVTADLNAGSLASCWWVEYGTTPSYGERAPAAGCLPAGASSEGVPIFLELASLSPATVYHYRIAAKNALGEAASGDETFRTFVPTTVELPDGRVTELVSSVLPGLVDEVHVPAGVLAAGLDFEGLHGETASEGEPERSSPDGSTVAFAADPPAEGGNGGSGFGGANEFLARRSPSGGWAQVALEPPGVPAQYVAMPGDLSAGVAVSSSILDGPAPAGYEDLYLRGFGWSSVPDGGFQASLSAFEPLFTVAPGCEPRQFGEIKFGVLAPLTHRGGGNAGTAAVPAFSHVLFQANAALPSTPVATAPSGCPLEDDLYDAVGGRLYLVNVLPDGSVSPGAMFGREGESSFGATPEAGNALSADGSRIYWSTAKVVEIGTGVIEERPLALFVRLNDTQAASKVSGERCAEPEKACTVQVDASALPGSVKEKAEQGGAGEYWDASSDGSRVVFTDQKALTESATASPGHRDLYQYDFAKPEGERLTDISMPPKPGVSADVQGVVGESEDGAWVYFVAGGILTEGANAEGKEPSQGQPNLYVRHEGRTAFVATLSGFDGELAAEAGSDHHRFGDLQADPGRRTADVTPDGHGVAFTSRAALTGYDNVVGGTPLAEVYVYDATTGRIACASCNPSGEPPTADIYNEFAADIPGELAEGVPKVLGSFLPVSESVDGYQPRLLSASGGRVFFNSIEPLVPQDTNGFLDVYEWEAPGEGGCTEASVSPVTNGCTYLLSGGQEDENSYLIDASENGSDVFFVSRAELVKHDEPPGFDELYDARVGGVEPPAEPTCEGSGCQGVPPAPPQFATPSSDTYNGPGNASSTTRSPAPGRHLTSVQARAAKLAAALKACRRRYPRNRTHRQSCERAARGKYGPARAKRAGRATLSRPRPRSHP